MNIDQTRQGRSELPLAAAATNDGQLPAAPSTVQQHTTASQASWQQYNSVFTAAKAGMQNVDKDKVKKIVYEMSKDSAHFKNEQRKQAQVDARVAQLKARAASLSAAELAAHQKASDAKVAQLEASRDLTRTWLHVDMDAFYASVEELDQPELKDKPMAVGGMGMITTANYEARKFGVRSAMPGFIARKLCPQLVFVKPNFKKYEAASAVTRDVFRLYDPHFAAGSLDEAYLDVTEHCRSHSMTGEQVAAELRERVTAATRLTCSVGIAPNAMLAKVASDLNKPNGQATVGSSRDAVMTFVHDLPIRKIPGIGKVSEQTLNALGVTTCGQLLEHRVLLTALFSNISSSFFLSVGLGLGQTQHDSSSTGRCEEQDGVGRKGISCERTFSKMSSVSELEAMAESLVQHLADDMASEDIEAKTLTLKLKTTDFQVRTRAVTLPNHVHTPEQMLPPIIKLLKAELPVEIRLMGVRGSALRKVQKPGNVLTAGSGGKLNALQRIILQSRQQQQQHEEGMVQQQQGLSNGPGSSAEQLLGQQQTAMPECIDILDDDDQCTVQHHEGDTCITDNDNGHISKESVAARPAGKHVHCMQHSNQRAPPASPCDAHQQQQEVQQDWQQLSGPTDKLCAETRMLYNEQQQNQQHAEEVPPTKRQRTTNARQVDQLLENHHQHQLLTASGRPLLQPTALHKQHQEQRAPVGTQGGTEVATFQPAPSPVCLPADSQHQAVPLDTGQQYAWEQQQPPSGSEPSSSALSTGGSNHEGCVHSTGQRRSRGTWACLVCTYSDNRQVMLRCEMCDTPKGSVSAPDMDWSSAPSAAMQAAKGHAALPRGKAGPGLIAEHKRKQGAAGKKQSSGKQLTLDQVVLPTRSTSEQ